MKRTIAAIIMIMFVLTQTGISYALRTEAKAEAGGKVADLKAALQTPAPAAGKVLIAHSDKSSRELLAEFLKRGGWEVYTAVTVDVAMKNIEGKDLVITEWGLPNNERIQGTEPKGQGKVLVDRIKQMDEETRPAVIVYTDAPNVVSETGFRGFRVLNSFPPEGVTQTDYILTAVRDVTAEKAQYKQIAPIIKNCA